MTSFSPRTNAGPPATGVASAGSERTPSRRGAAPRSGTASALTAGRIRGTYEGGGNHRGSVFRKRVGEAVIEREALHDEYPQWGEGSSTGRDLRLDELELERRVSEYPAFLDALADAVEDTDPP